MDRANSASRTEQLEPTHAVGQPPQSSQSEEASTSSKAPPHEDIEGIRAERDALLDRTARTQAEFENARKRLLREQQDFKDFALADALKSLLPTLDSFDWALNTPTTSIEEFRSGIELIRKQLHDALSKLGLRAIPVKGEPFDPYLHEAVDTVHRPDVQDNYVAEELQRGYKLGDRLLRPAMVLVGLNSKVS